MIFGLILVILGAIALLAKTGILTASVMSYIWPAVLILAGLLILWGRTYGRRHWSHIGCCCAPQEKLDTEQK